jgi:6-phosphogluconolactonase
MRSTPRWSEAKSSPAAMSEPQLHVLEDPAATVAELLAAQVRVGGAIVLTGGSTPARAYELAAAAAPNWRRVSLWWGDERCVPVSDERSNYGMARRTLLDRIAHLPDVHRIRGELAPAEAAAEYGDALSGVTLELLMLGLGPDAHIASLFPGSPQLAERSRLVTHGPAGLEPFVERVTLTLPALLAARRIVFLVAGADKADAVERAFFGEIDEAAPASLLRASETPIEVYLDPASAGAHASS